MAQRINRLYKILNIISSWETEEEEKNKSQINVCFKRNNRVEREELLHGLISSLLITKDDEIRKNSKTEEGLALKSG